LFARAAACTARARGVISGAAGSERCAPAPEGARWWRRFITRQADAAFGDQLSKAQIDDLVAYLRSKRKPQATAVAPLPDRRVCRVRGRCYSSSVAKRLPEVSSSWKKMACADGCLTMAAGAPAQTHDSHIPGGSTRGLRDLSALLSGLERRCIGDLNGLRHGWTTCSAGRGCHLDYADVSLAAGGFRV